MVAGAALVLLAQWFSTERMTRARYVTAEQEPELHAVLDRLCALADQPKPRLALSPDPAPNAYTVGRSRRSATIIGLMATHPDVHTRVARLLGTG